MSIADLGSSPLIDISLIRTSGIYFGGSLVPLSNYTEMNMTGQMTGPWIIGPTCTLKFSKINNRVTVCQTANVTAVQNAPAIMTFPTPLPVDYRPTNPALVYLPIWVYDGGAGGFALGSFRIDPATGIITFAKDTATNFSGSSNAALSPFSVTYDVTN